MTEQTRTIHADVKIRANETTINTAQGALIKRDWYLIGPAAKMVPGADLFVKTRRPYPAHVKVLGPIAGTVPESIKKAVTDGDVVCSYEQVKYDGTKRVAGEVRVTNTDRMNALESQNANLLKETHELKEMLTRFLAERDE
jgi:hypothetical protein